MIPKPIPQKLLASEDNLTRTSALSSPLLNFEEGQTGKASRGKSRKHSNYRRCGAQ